MISDATTYQAGIELLAQQAPESPWIAELKRLGYGYISAKYLEEQLQKTRPTAAKKKPNPKKRARDPILRDLYQKRTKLYDRRAKTSNKFHICKTDQARAKVSDDILEIQNEIKTLSLTISDYKETGQLPKAAKEYPIPRSALQRMKLLQSLRSQVSNKKAHIRTLHQLPDDTPNKGRRIEKAEAKLQKLITYKSYVERAVKKAK